MVCLQSESPFSPYDLLDHLDVDSPFIQLCLLVIGSQRSHAVSAQPALIWIKAALLNWVQLMEKNIIHLSDSPRHGRQTQLCVHSSFSLSDGSR